MTRAAGAIAVAVVLLGAAPAAEANRTCPTESSEQFAGTCGWWQPPLVRFELTGIASQLPIEPGDQIGSGPRPAHAGLVETQGGNIRLLMGPRWYLGVEIGLATVRSAPAIEQDAPAANFGGTGTVVTERVDRGIIMTSALVAGKNLTRGRLLLGVEGAIGWRIVALDGPLDHLVPEEESGVFIPQLLLEARGRAGVWLTPHISVSAQVGIGVIDQARTGAIVLGISPFPWDGLR